VPAESRELPRVATLYIGYPDRSASLYIGTSGHAKIPRPLVTLRKFHPCQPGSRQSFRNNSNMAALPELGTA